MTYSVYRVGDVVETTWEDPDAVVHGVAATITGTSPVLVAATVTMCGEGLPEGEVVIVGDPDVVDCDPCLADKWDGDLVALLATKVPVSVSAGAPEVSEGLGLLSEHRKRWLFS